MRRLFATNQHETEPKFSLPSFLGSRVLSRLLLREISSLSKFKIKRNLSMAACRFLVQGRFHRHAENRREAGKEREKKTETTALARGAHVYVALLLAAKRKIMASDDVSRSTAMQTRADVFARVRARVGT